MRVLANAGAAKLAALGLLGLLSANGASALRHQVGMKVGLPVEDGTIVTGTANGTIGWGTFDQLIDHKDPSKGTFKQRFWYATTYWKGPGSPIILVNPGEQSATGFNVTYTTESRLPGLFAKSVGGASIILEHRYWGESSPYDELTVENLQYLTLENSISDMTYFAKNFVLPFDPHGNSCPDNTPWVYSGGSYPGALAGWMAVLEPGVFWAYHGTSGVVEAIDNFWTYYEPIRDATPQNCSSDQAAAIDLIDQTLLHGSEQEKQALKDKFKLGDLTDPDFGAALIDAPSGWQETQFYSVPETGVQGYYEFCDYIENVWPNSTNKVPGAEGVGPERAVEGYAKWFVDIGLPGACEGYGYAEFNGTYNTLCFQNQNVSNPIYTDLTVGNPGNRQWNWMLCNQPFEWWQDAAPEGQPSFVSRLVDPSYMADLCDLWFPPSQGGSWGIEDGLTASAVNAYTGGWSAYGAGRTERLMLTNGQWDPWRDSTVSATTRPGGPLESTPDLPVFLVANGTHCSDYYQENWGVNPALQALVDAEVEQIVAWVDEFYEVKKIKRGSSGSGSGRRGVEFEA